MTCTISNAEHRAVKHENVVREAIETADDGIAQAEREALEIGGADVRQALLAAYAAARRLDAARKALD